MHKKIDIYNKTKTFFNKYNKNVIFYNKQMFFIRTTSKNYRFFIFYY